MEKDEYEFEQKYCDLPEEFLLEERLLEHELVLCTQLYKLEAQYPLE
jgi:hypothetical protein